MINIQTIQNVSDCVPLYLPHSLYLKPVAKMHITVALPNHKTGKTISNLDIMEKLSTALRPDKFLILRVCKNTIDYIRFEAELDDRSRLRSAISRIDGISLKISGFSESFRVRCNEPKDDFPTRHDWDSYFRDAKHMDEMKAGERPDTIHLTHLPIRWFCPRHSEHEVDVKPSESIFKRIFEKFGSVRCVDIPICDPFRNKMNAEINGMKTFSFEQDVLFEAYVQFDEYLGFVRAMDEFRGMKLVRKYVDKTQAINIVVNFDKTKHLSDAQMHRRERVRTRLIQKAKAEEEEKELEKKRELEEKERERKRKEDEKLAELEKQRQREEKRKEKHLKKIQQRGEVEISQKIRVEERKLMIAQRKLESIRILEQIFDRIRIKHEEKNGKRRQDEIENMMRERLVGKYKVATEQLVEEQTKKVKHMKSKTAISGLLKTMIKSGDSSSEEEDRSSNLKKNSTHPSTGTANVSASGANYSASNVGHPGVHPLNPFKNASSYPGTLPAPPNGSDQQPGVHPYPNEWMKSLPMFPFVPPIFPGVPPLYRPGGFPVSVNYRGNAPRRGFRLRGRGRGRGNMYMDKSQSGSYYNNYKNYKYDDEDDENEGEKASSSSYHKSSYNSSRSRNRTRSHSRSRSRTRSRSRSRYRSSRHYSKRSRSRRSSSRSSRSRSKTPPSRTNRKLASTRRSRSPSDSSDHHYRSRSRSRSRTSRSRSKSHSRPRSSQKSRARSRSRSESRDRSKRSWSRRENGNGSSHRRSNSQHHVVLEPEKLVRSAEKIKRDIENASKDRSRKEEEDHRDKEKHRKHDKNSPSNHNGHERSLSQDKSRSEKSRNNDKINASPVSALSQDSERKSSKRSSRRNSVSDREDK